MHAIAAGGWSSTAQHKRLDVLQEVTLAAQHHTVTDAQAAAASGTRALPQGALTAHAVVGQNGRSLSLLRHAVESTCSG